MPRLLAILLVLISTHTKNTNLHTFNFNTQHGTVIEQTIEDYPIAKDYYIVVLDDGNAHKGEPLRTVYGEI